MADVHKQGPRVKRVIVLNRSPGRRWLRWLIFIGLFFLLTGILATGAGFGYLYYLSKDLPSFHSVEEYKPLLGTRLYSSEGVQIGEFGIENREIVDYDHIPRLLILAFIAAEDEYFFDHFGLDPIGMVRAMVKNVKSGRFKEGASTITMQLARTFFLSPEKKMMRKLKEISLAIFKLEASLSKEDILWLYLNQIYLGSGSYGVQRASKIYFGKNVWELDLSEMALLAGMPKAPGRDSPFVNMNRAVERREYVLRRMVETGFITLEQKENAQKQPVRLAAGRNLLLEYAPHFTEHVRKHLHNTYGETMLYQEGMVVQATVDLAAQNKASESLYLGVRAMDHRQGYRGPLAAIPPAKRDAFLANLDKHYGKAPLRRDRIYYGLVTEVDDAKKQTTVSVGSVSAVIPFETMTWAKKVRPKNPWPEPVHRPSQVFRPGDVVMVRPADPEHLKNNCVIACPDPVDRKTMHWILEQEPKVQSALFARDIESGYVLAMEGGYHFERSEFNRAVQACRQPGSAFKPIVYAAAVDNDWTVATPILDAPFVESESLWAWMPDNYDDEFKGEVSVRYAIQFSLNIPAIKTLMHVTGTGVVEFAQRLGIRSKVTAVASAALGSECVTPEDLTNAYAIFPNQGRKVGSKFVKFVIDREGNVLEDNRVFYDPSLDVAERLDRMEEEVLSEPEMAVSPVTAYLATWLLTQPVQGGTASDALVMNRPLGGKTGTTNDYYDAWFVGFSPDVAAGVWIGFDDNCCSLGPGETGGRAALPIWLEFMKEYLKQTPPKNFKVPGGIVWRSVDYKTGYAVKEGGVSCPFREGTGPETAPSEEMGSETIFGEEGIY